MGVLNPKGFKLAPFVYGCVLGVLLVYGGYFVDKTGFFGDLIERVYAVVNDIEPNGDGTTAGTPTGCTIHADCLSDATTAPTTPSTADFVVLPNNGSDYYQMQTLPAVDTVSQIVVQTYHQDGANMATYVSLWDATESTQYGTEVQLTQRATADWDSATFSGLTLNQTQIDGLRVRLSCARPGGGKANDCTQYAMYATVTYTEQIDITVSTTGSQQNVEVGATSAHVGGAFVISEDTGSRNLTSITIEETGTVDEVNDLDNIELYYELAADCSAQTYDGTETQFGSTDTNGFDGSARSTFIDSVTITTANDMCVYVVLDVGTGASFGETIELQITNPSSDVVGSGGAIVTPATVIALADTTILEEIVLTQTRYHWRQDNGDESDNALLGADSATGGSQNTPMLATQKSTNYRIRLEVDNAGNATSTAAQYRLEYATKVTTCTAATGWTDVHAAADDWDMSLSANIADGNTTNITTTGKGALTDDGVDFVGTGALRETTSLSGSITLDPDEFTELEYSIIGSSSISDGTTYCFRVTDNGTPLDSYTAYPEAAFNADVTVSAEQTQVSTASIPSTGVVIGGFLFSSTSAGSQDIDSITITASSTADVTTDFDNIELYWEYDNTVPVDCASETYGGVLETQYGATDTDGFSGAGTSTFTQAVLPPSVNTTRALCLYVVLDVTSSATNGEKLDIQIANPSVDVVLSTGSVAPASLVDLVGVTTLVAPYTVQTAYHWREDDGTETTATSATGGVENTSIDEFPALVTKRLRFAVHNQGGETTGNYQYELEWAQRTSTCDAVASWTSIDTAADEWAVVASQLVDNADTTNINESAGGVSDTGSFKGTNGAQQDVDGITGNIDLAANEQVEIEYSLQADSSAVEGTAYCFRLTNNGTVLDQYDNYAEATIKLATDFAVYRGVSDITGTSITLTNGVDYNLQFNDASRAFIRITNPHHTGGGLAAGTTGNHSSADMTAYISNPENITTSVNLTRFGATDDTQVAWEIIEYIGEVGGENEIIVRSAAAATYAAANTALTTGTVSGIADDNDVVPFITGQANVNTGRFYYHSGLSIATWNAGADTVTFTRGDNGNNSANPLSYAVVEFTGANWKVQRIEHTYTTAGVVETESMTAVNSISRAFVHTQHLAGANQDQHGDFGHEVWMGSIGTLSFRIDGVAQTAANHTSVGWVIENTQTTGDRMIVTRSNDTIVGAGGGLSTVNISIGRTVDDLSVASLFINTRNHGTGRSYPEPLMMATIISDTQYQIQISDDADDNTYRTEVVEWPTASRKLQQNDFQLYEDNNILTPSVPWSGLAENAEMTALDDPIAATENIRIRMSLRVTAAAMPANVDSFKLEYGERVTSCAAITNWLRLGDTGSTTALWRGFNASPVDGDTLPSTVLSESTISGTYEEENDSAVTPNLALVNDVVEFDWNVEHNNAAQKTDYCFRMVESDGTPFEVYDTYPLIRTVGYGPEIGQWRFYDDETNETPTVPLGAGESSAPAGIDNQDIIKLRATLAEKSGADGVDVKFKVQFSEYPDFSNVFDVVATSTCTATSTWCYADGAGVDNEQINTSLLSDADSCVSGAGTGCGTHNEGTSTVSATFDHSALTNAEFEFTLKNAGARVNAVYYFRLWNLLDDEVVPASSTYPSLLAASSSLTFSVDGVSSGTVIGTSVTTDVATASTSIGFGAIPFDTEFEAAHQLTVDTNATEGYQILLYADQDLTNTYGTKIASTTGTNALPVSWSSGCLALNLGCFGYHTTDATLAGGSARFGAEDTYAAFTTTPQEIMYSSIPGSDTHDIVYKIQVGQEQEAGDYQKTISYMAIPVF